MLLSPCIPTLCIGYLKCHFQRWRLWQQAEKIHSMPLRNYTLSLTVFRIVSICCNGCMNGTWRDDNISNNRGDVLTLVGGHGSPLTSILMQCHGRKAFNLYGMQTPSGFCSSAAMRKATINAIKKLFSKYIITAPLNFHHVQTNYCLITL